jgi:hypothetical protein
VDEATRRKLTSVVQNSADLSALAVIERKGREHEQMMGEATAQDDRAEQLVGLGDFDGGTDAE